MRVVPSSFRAALALLAALCILVAPAQAASARKAGVDLGAPSVHLRYKDSDASSYYSEVTVKRSVPGTYFAVTAWHNGYFGLQERGDGRKVLIFSVWGSNSDNPASMPANKRVTIINKDPAVRTGDFGNEGSGAQAFFDYDWKLGTTYAFMVKAKVVDDRAEYSGYFRAPDSKRWHYLVTMSTPHEPTLLRGLHSFVEDFRSVGSRSAARDLLQCLDAQARWQHLPAADVDGHRRAVEREGARCRSVGAGHYACHWRLHGEPHYQPGRAHRPGAEHQRRAAWRPVIEGGAGAPGYNSGPFN